MRIFSLIALFAGAAWLCSQPSPQERVGPLPSGGFMIPNGWRVMPAGKQVPLDTFPMASALSRDGKYLLILNGGYRPPSISVMDVATVTVTSSVKVPDGWLGLTFTPKGDRVYVGGGSRAAVYEFSFDAGKLAPARTFTVVPDAERTNRDFIGDVALSPDGRLLYAADLYHDSVVVINPQSGRVIERVKTGRRPYRILFHPDGKSFFVSSWADGAVGHYDAATNARLANLSLAPHPTDMVWLEGKNEEAEGPKYAARLFVAAANTNSVYVIGVSESKELQRIETINVSMTPRQPLGMTPSALSLSPDRKRLYVVCSDANVVAVTELEPERSRVAGFIPTGWYPTAVRALPDGRVVVLNGRGLRSFPNPQGPNPTKRPEPVHEGVKAIEYVGHLQTGTASILEPITDASLRRDTQMAFANSAYRDDKLDAQVKLPPIEHVIYCVKENRTYDQVLGDIKEANGDPSLVLFGENVTPNLHKISREFVLLDNFYVNSDVSADGHNWSMAAIAPDYVQKMWPNSYAGRRKLYDYEGTEPAASAPAGYLWTNAASAGVSIRNYGYYANNGKAAGPGEVQVASVRDPILSRVTNMKFRGFDLEYADVERAKVFIDELQEFEKTGQMPKLIILRLGTDHTYGMAAGKLSPLSMVADNDYAVGMVVEALSKSRFWSSTAMFVLEDDAQNGSDHVDSHRSTAYVISPYTRKRGIDDTMYNTTSMLRTMEMLLGLRPMTQFDAASRPMASVFKPSPDPSPYTAEKPRISLTDRNPAGTRAAARSDAMDFTAEDRIDDDELNDILWRAIRKTDPPPPVRSYFAR